MSQTADHGVLSLIPARSHTYIEIDHEIISMVILLLWLIQEGLLSVTSAQSTIKQGDSNHEVMVCFGTKFKLTIDHYS